jgi:DNA polymerase V
MSVSSSQPRYLCIDLKSFYASVECVERGLDPLTTKLVVADPTRSEKTICLAVSPALKALGVKNRCRVFQIPQHIDYLMAPPRMQLNIDYSAEIYGIYLSYFDKDDIHVYSIDEAFMDVAPYLELYGCTTRELGEKIRREILDKTGIPATCGMGTNLYLAKVALDISAKHSADFFGYLDEDLYKETLWNHRPLTDFWRIGPGTVRRLATLDIHTMGQVALYPYPEDLYELFGIDAEILIDHAWGREPVTIADIKAYRPKARSNGVGQVLARGYRFDEARTVIKEMVGEVSLELSKKGLVTSSVTLTVGFERETYPSVRATARMSRPTNSTEEMRAGVLEAFDEVVPPDSLARRLTVYCNDTRQEGIGQLDLFSETHRRSDERKRQAAIAQIKSRFGKNAMLRGTDLMPSATQRERNGQIGGHRSGV